MKRFGRVVTLLSDFSIRGLLVSKSKVKSIENDRSLYRGYRDFLGLERVLNGLDIVFNFHCSPGFDRI